MHFFSYIISLIFIGTIIEICHPLSFTSPDLAPTYLEWYLQNMLSSPSEAGSLQKAMSLQGILSSFT
jgi:hypothetical protein